MAQPPVYDGIDESDVPGIGKDAARLLKPLSEFMKSVKVALDSGLTLRNLAAYAKTVEVVGVDEDQGAPAEDGAPPLFLPFNPKPFPKPIQFTLGERGKPFPGEVQEIRVTRVVRGDGNLPGPVSVEGWQAGPLDKDGRRTITLPRVNGLAPGVKYSLTLLIQSV